MLAPREFVVAVLAIAFIASMTAAAHSIVVEVVYSAATSPYNIGWNGTSRFVEALREAGYEVRVIEDLKVVEDEGKVLLAIIAPESNYTREEVEALKSLMGRSSLRLLIADENYKTAGSLLKPLFGASLHRGLLATRVGRGEYVFSQNVTVELNGRTYRITLNRPGAFSDVGSLTPIVYSNGTVESAIVGVEGPPVFERKRYPIVCLWREGDDGAVVVSDSSLFINLYWEGNTTDNPAFTLELVKLLTGGDTAYKVYVDDSHYRLPGGEESVVKVQARVPTPPIGLILGLMIAAGLRYIDYFIEEIVRFGAPLLGAIIGAVFAYTVYRYLSALTADVRSDEIAPKVDYVEVLAETPIFKRYSSLEGLTRRDYESAITTLYELLSSLLEEEAGIQLDAAVEGDEHHAERLISLLGPSWRRIVRTLRLMKRIRDSKYKGGRVLPPILFWRATFERCVRASEEVLRRLGITILGEEGRRVEYLWRGS